MRPGQLNHDENLITTNKNKLFAIVRARRQAQTFSAVRLSAEIHRYPVYYFIKILSSTVSNNHKRLKMIQIIALPREIKR